MLAAPSGLEDVSSGLVRLEPSPLRCDAGDAPDAPLDVVGRRGREGADAPLFASLDVLEAAAVRGRLTGADGPACSVPRSVGVLVADGPCAERAGRGRRGPERRGGMLAGAS
ncbi:MULTISPECIES: hypothetical protein [Actinomyces]|uniref:hypothetical protein n=1 Tax=Actinomyces TaxID=1654 RepID=UPI000AC8A8F0|nr:MULTISPECIES: hypothetical protein [Actinomyces]